MEIIIAAVLVGAIVVVAGAYFGAKTVTNAFTKIAKGNDVYNSYVCYSHAPESVDEDSEYVRVLEQKLADAEHIFKDINGVMSTTRPLTEEQLDKVSDLAVEGWTRMTDCVKESEEDA